MTKPTTEELKELLGKVTQGEWSLTEDDWIGWHVHYEDEGVCHAITFADATLIALAPTLAAEVARLRLHLSRMLMAQDGVPINAIEFGRWVDEARQAIDATSEK